ncbi:MAG TPA: gamma-glutamyltransferase [Candidatus Binatia bacterium]|nr:gamma-glutamyltransferase [Candidatus Binatia bacterium]
MLRTASSAACCVALFLAVASDAAQRLPDSRAERPVLHGRHWVAITGKPLGATAGARMFERGGNAVDAACAMLGAVCTMYDDLAWGGETQALIYDPRTKKVVGINALGVAPRGATPEFFRERKLNYPPGEGPLAALTPGTAGGLMTMLAEYGTLSLKEVLSPALEMAEGYPVEEENSWKIQHHKEKLKQWPYSRKVLLPHLGEGFEGPRPGEILRQPQLQATLQKLVDAEAQALKAGKDRKQAIYAAYDRFYKGDIAEEFVRGSREQGGLHILQDLAQWEVKIETPLKTTYKGIEVHKLSTWTQGGTLLAMLNLLEPLDLPAMGYNSARYIHALSQAMNLAFADRDFYFGDPYFAPEEPIRGLLSKDYARQRWQLVDWTRNDPDIRPGDPYPFEGRINPFQKLLRNWSNLRFKRVKGREETGQVEFETAFRAGTTTVEAADEAGWVVSMVPSGGWMPVCLAGNTGLGMSQRMQSFVLDEAENPFNVLAPGKRPRVTLSPSIATLLGRPYLCFAVQGGDAQEQNLLQCFLNIVEFDLNVQEACEAANFNTYQTRTSFDKHEAQPGRLLLNEEVPAWVRRDLLRMGYRLETRPKTSGPITAIYFDWEHNTLWGGVSNDGDDHGVVW